MTWFTPSDKLPEKEGPYLVKVKGSTKTTIINFSLEIMHQAYWQSSVLSWKAIEDFDY